MRTPIILALFFLGMSLAGVAQKPANDKSASQLFQQKCAMCHSADGSGSSAVGKQLGAKDLRSAEVQKMSEDDLVTAITKGKGKMPGFGVQLSEAQIKGLVDEVRHCAGRSTCQLFLPR